MPTLVQIMACRLFDTRPLPEPMLQYCQSGPRKHISLNCFFKFKSFYSRKCTWKCRLWSSSHFVRPQCVKGKVPVDSLAPVTVRWWPSMVHKSIIQCGAVITRSIFTNYPHKTPHSSSVRAREVLGICFVFQVWFMFSCHFSAVFNIMLKWTTL